MGKIFNTKSFLISVEDAIKAKLRQEGLVSLDQFRQVHKKNRTPRVLVVEDDEAIQRSLSRILEKQGLRVIVASDGSKLSDVLDHEPVDLIILDVGLPWLNGYELARLMKANADLASIPIIFVSGMCTKDDIKRGFELGASDYIKKPFEVEEIQRAVNTLLVLNT